MCCPSGTPKQAIVAESDTAVGSGAQVLENKAPVEEEDIVGIGVEGRAQWRGGVGGSFSSLLKGSVCKQICHFISIEHLAHGWPSFPRVVSDREDGIILAQIVRRGSSVPSHILRIDALTIHLCSS